MRRLLRDHGQWSSLDEVLRGYQAKGYVIPVSLEQVQSPREWFLPIFAVQNPNKPGKWRIVWDGAAEVQVVSLNLRLLTGPDLNAPLVHVLMRFRLGKWQSPETSRRCS